ncbi:MAG: hypothetical protein PVJ67_03625 [Candidatus Pacearchaeota archaeon]|jgi:hypothetical protein
MENKDNEISETIKNSVIARIDAQVPTNLKLAMGSYGAMDKEEMIRHVREDDKIGRQIVKRHLQFLRAVASGELTRALVSVD